MMRWSWEEAVQVDAVDHGVVVEGCASSFSSFFFLIHS